MRDGRGRIATTGPPRSRSARRRHRRRPGLRGGALPAPAGDYDDWGLYAWGDIDPAYATVAQRAAVRRRGRVRPVRLGEAQARRQERRLHRGRLRRRQGRRAGPLPRPDARPARSGSSRATRRSYPAGGRRRADRQRPGHGGHPLPPGRRRLRRLGPAPVGRRGQPDRVVRAAAARPRPTRSGRCSGCRWPPARPG